MQLLALLGEKWRGVCGLGIPTLSTSCWEVSIPLRTSLTYTGLITWHHWLLYHMLLTDMHSKCGRWVTAVSAVGTHTKLL